MDASTKIPAVARAEWYRTTKPVHAQDHLTGLRGILVLQSFVWIFLSTFVPGVVYINDVDAPLYQEVIRKIFSPLFYNQTLITAFFIILSARTVCVPFLSEPTVNSYAGSLIRRPLRVGIPLAVGLAVSIAVFSTMDDTYVSQVAALLGNPNLSAPTNPPSALAGFNAIFDLLWVVRDFSTQAGNTAWPSATMDVPSIIYYQSYTVYIFMVILPFTRAHWHWQGVVLFGLGSYWFDSWGWYSAAGMFIADLALNKTLQEHVASGIVVRGDSRLPTWVPATACLAIGVMMKYVWNSAFPERIRDEIALHPVVHLSDATNFATFADGQAYARLDDFCVVFGSMVLIELLPAAQRLLSARPLVYLGDRSMSFFVAQSIIVYTLGMKLFLVMHETRGLSIAASNAVALVACVPAVWLGAEIFHRMVDQPSKTFAKVVFRWTRT